MDIIAPPPPTAAASGAASGASGPDAEGGTDFATLLGAATAEGGEKTADQTPATPADPAQDANAEAGAAMTGLLTGAAAFVQAPAVPVSTTPTPPQATTPAASGAPAQTDGAAGPKPGEIAAAVAPKTASAETPTKAGAAASPTVAGQSAAAPTTTPAQTPAPPATTAPASAPTQAQAQTQTQTGKPAPTAQAATEALARAGLTAGAQEAPPEVESGLARLQGLIQDGARRSGLRDGGGTAKAVGETTAATPQSGQTQASASATASTPAPSSPQASAVPDVAVRPDAGQANAALLEPPPALDPGSAAAAEIGPDGRPALDHPAAVAVREAGSGLSRATVETTAQIAAQILRRLEGRSTRFEMALTPEGLGRVDVSLDIDADGRLAARLAFDNPAAATDLRGRADELRRQLQDAGFQLAGDALDFSQRDPSSGEGFDRRPSRAFAGAARLHAETDAVAATPARWHSLTLTPEGVDMKV